MPTTKATRLLFIIPFLLLAGCASEFDKCMNTELPRAEKISGLNAEREAGLQLMSLRETLEKWGLAAKAVAAWEKTNPPPLDIPEYPDYKCSELTGDAWSDCRSAHDKLKEEFEAAEAIWEASPEVIRWKERLEEAALRLYREQGLPLFNMEELPYSEIMEKFDTFVAPRSEIWQCRVDPDCDDNRDENIDMKAIDEAMLTNASTISEMAEATKELATVTCNNNGFYE